MVKKSNGKWRMCVDFTNLNAAYLKDGYPLPRIDSLVDSMVRYPYISFLDVFSGYHQIRIDLTDMENTSFIKVDGLFCYNMMPFRLKNASTTYQRLMDKVFGS